MKLQITAWILCSLFVLSSCNSAKDKKLDTETDLEEVSARDEAMQEKGYQKGIIIYSDAEGDCEYVIRLKNEPETMFDPINLGQELKVNEQEVWFTYTSLRMKNRCDKANPVSLKDIVKVD